MIGAPLHCYEACGLTIGSDSPIIGLCASTDRGSPDVTISMRESAASAGEDHDYSSVWYVSPEVHASGRPEMTIAAGPSGFRLAYGDAVTFFIDRSGQRVVARWTSSGGAIAAARHLAGSVLAFILRLRGAVPLHASAVAIDGRSLLFVGDSWAGKSSIATAFSTLGHRLLADDIVRVDASGDDLVAYPSHPRVHVWGDSAATLLGAIETVTVDSDAYHKESFDVLEAGSHFETTPAPIKSVYLLKERAAGRRQPGMVRMPPREALIALVRHTYGGCFLDQDMRARELDVLARLVERVPVRELTLGDSLQDLVSSCRTLATAHV